MGFEALKSVGKTIDAGFNLGVGRGFAGFAGKKGVLDGVMKVGAVMGTGAAIGATLGAASTIPSDGNINPLAGAAVGAGIGAAAIPAASIGVGAIGSAGVGAAKLTASAGILAGKGAVAASPFAAAMGAKAATNVAGSVWGFGRRMIDWNESADAFSKVKFTGPITGAKAGFRRGLEGGGALGKLGDFASSKKHAKLGKALNKVDKGLRAGEGAISGSIINGKTMMGAVAAVEGFSKAFDTIEKAKMGQMVGVQSVAPRTPSYADNAGASGDLVFALNANRRG